MPSILAAGTSRHAAGTSKKTAGNPKTRFGYPNKGKKLQKYSLAPAGVLYDPSNQEVGGLISSFLLGRAQLSQPEVDCGKRSAHQSSTGGGGCALRGKTDAGSKFRKPSVAEQWPHVSGWGMQR